MIIRAAPDPALAEPVRLCREDDLLDSLIPFSSVIVLGVVIAVEDRFNITITGDELARACATGATLQKLAVMVDDLSSRLHQA